jgi:hypothetical protein
MRLLIWLLLAYIGYRLAKTWLGRKSARETRPVGQPQTGGAIDDVMIRDPLCGVYFPRRDGVCLQRGDQQLFFCSPECRDRYLARHGHDPHP